jgi:single-strand DNA-binding protein
MNTVTIVGNLVHAPEIKYVNGHATVTVAVAVNRKYTSGGVEREQVSYFDVQAWRDLAENIATSLSKGDRVIVTGRPEQQTWERKDGGRASKVQIVAEDMGPSLRFASAEVVKPGVVRAVPRVVPDDAPFDDAPF